MILFFTDDYNRRNNKKVEDDFKRWDKEMEDLRKRFFAPSMFPMIPNQNNGPSNTDNTIKGTENRTCIIIINN